jgi:hypothetical protein
MKTIEMKDTNEDTKDSATGLAKTFKRLPTKQLKKLRELVTAELEQRGAKDDLGGMSSNDFSKHLEEQLSSKSTKGEK